MIYKLQKKFIRICIISFLVVYALIFGTIYGFTYYQAAVDSDNLADIIMGNNESFPHGYSSPDSPSFMPNSIGPEAPFTTRFFIVHFDPAGHLISANTSSIVSVTHSEAVEYGHQAMRGDSERGWINMYRYKTIASPRGTSVIFINNDQLKNTINLIFTSAAVILFGGGLVFLAVVSIFSKRAVKPVAESYEKQKRFITDANHELKTPLTLMLTNLDIIESEIGPNEWLEDIRAEGNHMADLIGRLTQLARMDEDNAPVPKEGFDLSKLVQEVAEEFSPASEHKGLLLDIDIETDILYWGIKAEIQQMLRVLMENAVKYCDSAGSITVQLKTERCPVLSVTNTYSAVSMLELDSLFDRFYRADKARTTGSGFGIGLSIAKVVAENHNAEIRAENIENADIRFTVKL